MKKRTLKNGGRDRAFWGALIPAAASLVGSIFTTSAQKDAQEEAIKAQKQAALESLKRQQLEQTVSNTNNYLTAVGQIPEQTYAYKNGGRRKLRNRGISITDGGYAIPIDYNTSLLRGSLHSQINETGNTGIGINVGNKEIEAENGEVIQKKGNEFRVFSAQPMFDGISPAEAVLDGANKDDVFKAQESIKRRYHLRNGKSTPVERNRAAFGATFTTPDYIGLGTNIGASILSGILANSAYNNLDKDINYSLPSYIDESYVSGPTKWDITGRKAEIRRAQLMGRRNIARNTASSAVGLGRMQELDTNTMYELNKLLDEKTNKEIELRQANAEREQAVRGRNAAARNAYYQRVADIKNQQLATRLGIKQSKLNSNIGTVQGIGSSIGGFLQQGIDNYQNKQSMLAQIATSPYGTAERLHSLGYKFDKDMMQSFKNDAASRLEKYRNDFSNAGIKAYDDAVSSYNLWSNSLGSTDRAKSSKMRINLRTVGTTPIFGQDTNFLTRKPIIRL